MMEFSKLLGKWLTIKKLQKFQLRKNVTKEILILYQVISQKIGLDKNTQNIGKHGVKVLHLPN